MESTKKNTEPGWNDPPVFSYTESIEHIRSPKRNILNKRVAYPLNNNITKESSITDPTSVPNFNPNLPPPPLPCSKSLSTPRNTSPNEPESISNECNPEYCDSSKIDHARSETMLNEIITNIDQVITDRDELLRSQNKHEHVRKKIHIMKESWKSKLTDDIKGKLLRLSEALKENNKDTANEIQASLMVDYPKLCSEFISAFRLLININETTS